MDAGRTGTIIKNARNEKGLSQEKLAAELHVTRAAVSRWETGKGFPDISILPELAEALDVSIDELVTGEKKEKEANQQGMKELIEISEKEKKSSNHRIIMISFLIICALIISCIYINKQQRKMHLEKEMADELSASDAYPRLAIPVIRYENTALMRIEDLSNNGEIPKEELHNAFGDCTFYNNLSDPDMMQAIRNDFASQIRAMHTIDAIEEINDDKLIILDSGTSTLTLYSDGIVLIQNGSRSQYFLLDTQAMNAMETTVIRNIQNSYEVNSACMLNVKGE